VSRDHDGSRLSRLRKSSSPVGSWTVPPRPSTGRREKRKWNPHWPSRSRKLRPPKTEQPLQLSEDTKHGRTSRRCACPERPRKSRDRHSVNAMPSFAPPAARHASMPPGLVLLPRTRPPLGPLSAPRRPSVATPVDGPASSGASPLSLAHRSTRTLSLTRKLFEISVRDARRRHRSSFRPRDVRKRRVDGR
jgi:hypothetical protein